MSRRAGDAAPAGRRRWVTAELDVPAAAAWSVLVDTRCWPEWGPSVRDVELDSGSAHLIGPGSTGWVRTAVGVRVPFRITRFEPGREWSWRVAGVPATDHRVEPLDAERCRVGFGVPAVMVAYLAVCRVALARIGRLAGARAGPAQ